MINNITLKGHINTHLQYLVTYVNQKKKNNLKKSFTKLRELNQNIHILGDQIESVLQSKRSF